MHVKTERRLKQHLAEAEQRVSADELQLMQQRDTVEKRLRYGLDLEHAMTLLAKMEKSQQLLLKERDHLRDELAANGTASDKEVERAQDPNCRSDSQRCMPHQLYDAGRG